MLLYFPHTGLLADRSTRSRLFCVFLLFLTLRVLRLQILQSPLGCDVSVAGCQSKQLQVGNLITAKVTMLRASVHRLVQHHRQHIAELAKPSRPLDFNGEGRSHPECQNYFAEGQMRRTIAINVWRSLSSYEVDDIAIVTQTSQNRIERIETLLQHWPGPLSVAIYVDTSDLTSFFSNIIRCPLLFTRNNIDLHLVAKHGSLYPVNLLRNVALNNTRTSYVQILDIDLAPSSNMYKVLRLATGTFNLHKRALVTPAFEFIYNDTNIFPRSKSSLLDLLSAGRVRQFRFVYQPGHAPTLYDQWKNTLSPYIVKYAQYYEPYVLLRRNETPAFDERFLGRTYDRSSHIQLLYTLGFQLEVLPNTFVLHYPHEQILPSKEQKVCAAVILQNLRKTDKIQSATRRTIRKRRRMKLGDVTRR